MHPDETCGEYTVSADPGRLDLAAVHALLDRTYWSAGIPLPVLARAVAHSVCVGVYHETAGQVGFARVVTDRATFAYLCDVVVAEGHRGRGLSKRMMEAVMAHPDLQGLRRFCLVTKDAHDLYRRYGFAPAAEADGYMHIAGGPGFYLREAAGAE